MYLEILSHTCIKTLQIPETHNVKEKRANMRNLNYTGGHGFLLGEPETSACTADLAVILQASHYRSFTKWYSKETRQIT